jgi:hypothetical protein
MKAFVITLLILAGIWAAYDGLWLSPEQSVLQKRFRPVAELTPITPKQVVEQVKAEVFQPPLVESLEVLTRDWTWLPNHAFPRAVVLKKPVTLVLPAGRSEVRAGTTVQALGMTDGLLEVAMTQGSKARGKVSVKETDVIEQITVSYEKWKTERQLAARQAWETQRVQGARGPVERGSDPQGRPVQKADGSYPLLLASMTAGEVTEITPAKVKSWSAPKQVVIDGQPTWTVDVDFSTVVFCGPIDAKAQARVRAGRVVAWVYPGSGEPVP